MKTTKITERVLDYKSNRNDYHYGVRQGTKQVYSRRTGKRYETPRFVKKKIGYSAKALAEWFQTQRPDAKVTVCNYSEIKKTHPRGFVYFTGGGKREYNGYRIEIEVDGHRLSHNTTETYRTTSEIVDFMLEHLNLD